MVYDFVVLMGPPGVGKSYLGCLLRDQLGMIYTPLEPELRSRFGTEAELLSRKVEALALIEATLTQQQAAVDRPVVVESTGVSEREMLQRLAANYRVLFIQVTAPQEVCVQRVASRPPDENLNNDLEYTSRFHEYWVNHIAPQYDFDLIIENRDAKSDEVVAKVRQYLTGALNQNNPSLVLPH